MTTMKTTAFETDDVPTTYHILVVNNDGKCIHQTKIREARDYSKEHMLEKGCYHLLNLAKQCEILKYDN